jgi:hypothetical protein
MKCAHCQKVHNNRFECPEIKSLRTFVGDDKHQAKLERKKRTKRN